MTDIAEAAGVSIATVDRVMNRRKGVKERTVARVLDAAVALGYLTEAERARRGDPPPLNVVFLLPHGGNPYLKMLGDRVREVSATGQRGTANIRCFHVDSFDVAALAEALRHHAGWADALAFMATDHPVVRDAVEELVIRGKTLVTVVSDLPHSSRVAYVGLDNQAVGRTAGYLMGRFAGARQGSVALLAGSRIYRTHSERETGFQAILEEMFPNLRVVGIREGHDNREENYQHALAFLEETPDLVGIYNVGGSSDGIARALREKGRAEGTILIGHGLTPDTRRLLLDGTMDAVLNLDPDTLITATLDLLTKARGRGLGPGEGMAPRKVDIFFRENLPPNG